MSENLPISFNITDDDEVEVLSRNGQCGPVRKGHHGSDLLNTQIIERDDAGAEDVGRFRVGKDDSAHVVEARVHHVYGPCLLPRRVVGVDQHDCYGRAGDVQLAPGPTPVPDQAYTRRGLLLELETTDGVLLVTTIDTVLAAIEETFTHESCKNVSPRSNDFSIGR